MVRAVSSASSVSTAAGWMLRSSSSPWPLTVALTRPPPRRAGHLGVRQRLLGIHELFLHLLRRGEQLLHIHLGFHIALLRRAYDHPSAVKPLRRAGLSLRIRRSPDRPARAG